MNRRFGAVLALTVMASVRALADDPASAPAPAATCHAAEKTVCVPTPYVKDVKKVSYATGFDTICPCFYHGLLRGSCGCDKGHCEKPVQVRYLVKKVKHCPVDAVKCQPAVVPACSTDRGRLRPQVTAAPPVAEPAPTGIYEARSAAPR